MPLIPLTSEDLHLWLLFESEARDPELLESCRRLLSSDERSREERFRRARNRESYVLTRALVRTVLSRYAPLAPEEWQFSTNAHGRPQIANANSGANLSFNVAHTRGLIAMAVTQSRPVGIDAEHIGFRERALNIAESFFAPSEVAALRQQPREAQTYCFFEYWTFKESYLKARGLGLSMPLDRFSFEFRTARSVQLCVNPEFDDEAARWTFWQLQPSPDHLLALCCWDCDAALEPLARKIVPGRSEELISMSWSRRSR